MPPPAEIGCNANGTHRISLDILPLVWYLVKELESLPAPAGGPITKGVAVGYQTKIQLIKRKASEQWYVNFPAAIAHAMEFDRGEMFEWIIEDNATLVLRRLKRPDSALKKKRHSASSTASTSSGPSAAQPSNNTAPGNEHGSLS